MAHVLITYLSDYQSTVCATKESSKLCSKQRNKEIRVNYNVSHIETGLVYKRSPKLRTAVVIDYYKQWRILGHERERCTGKNTDRPQNQITWPYCCFKTLAAGEPVLFVRVFYLPNKQGGESRWGLYFGWKETCFSLK